jgi:hypothetical protein
MDQTKSGGNEPEIVQADGPSIDDLAAQLIARSQVEEAPEPAAETPEDEQEETVNEEVVAEEPADEEQPAEEEEQPSEEVPSQEEKSDKLPTGVQKRIDRAVRKQKEAEAKAESLAKEYEAKLASMQALVEQKVQTVPSDSPDSPLGGVNTIEELEKRRSDAESIVEWAEEALDREEEVVSVGGKDYTRAEIKAIKRQNERVLAREVPARLQFLQARQAVEQKVSGQFDWMKDKTSREYLVLQHQLKAIPELARRADGKELLAYMIEGAKVMLAKQNAAKEPAKKPTEKPKPKPPVVSVDSKVAPPPRRSESATKYEALRRQILSDPDGASEDSMVQLLLAKQR